jgi:ketosteroid isomerase-like protein
MRTLLPAAILVLVTGLLAPITTSAASLQEQVSAAYAAWDAAFNKGDPKAVAAFYTEDAVLLPPTHEVLKGPAEIAKFFAGLFGAGVTGHKLVLLEANGAGSTVVAAARWSAKGKDGASLGGIATHEFVKQADGSLKLRLHTFN